MIIETPYENLTPETVWGSCPGPQCDGQVEWFEEGPICPECGHLWDSEGGDIGSWDENMGTPWAESKTRHHFQKRDANAKAFWAEIREAAGARA